MRFFFVDRVDELKPGKSIRGIKNLALSEDFFQDHFPDNPLFPGTLLVEAMAQLAGFLVEATFNKPGEAPRRAVLGQIEKAKFHRACRPGDQLDLRGRLISDLENAAQVECEAFCGAERVAKATLTFVLLHVKSEKVHQQRRDLYSLWTQHLKLPLEIR